MRIVATLIGVLALTFASACGPMCLSCGSGLGDPCSASRLCASGLQCGVSGTCEIPSFPPGVCVANTRRCDGTTVEICDSGGTAWVPAESCEWGCEEGLCLDPEVSPDAGDADAGTVDAGE